MCIRDRSQSGVDWITVTGKRELLEWILEYGKLRWGDAVLGVGGDFYRQGWKFQAGAKLLFDGSTKSMEGTFCLKVPGSALSPATADERHEWLRDLLAAGVKVTRLDVALDLEDERGVGLVDAVVSACERGELTGAKCYERRRPMSGSRIMGNSVYLGRRGKFGSGRMTRIYDKGLETKGRAMGEWERLEVEFSGKCAHEVALALCAADDWAPIAFARVLGAVDFREATGRRELKRRPRAGWWSEFLNEQMDGGEVVRTKAKPREPDIARYEAWLRDVAWRNLQSYMEVLGMTYDEVAAWASQGDERKREAWQDMRPVMWQLVKRQEREGRAASARLGVPF